MAILSIAKHDASEELEFVHLLQPTPEQKVLLEKIYKSKDYTNAIKLMLSFMKERGFLDTLI
jgi:hypothetical protein